MKIAIDISPLASGSGHKIRGVGFYLENLKDSLQKYFPHNQYIFFSSPKESPADVDVTHYPYFDPFFFTLPLFRKSKIAVTVHDLTPIIFPDHFPAGLKGKFKWQIQKNILKNVDVIITVSHASKKDIVKIIGIPDKKVHVVYLAASENFKKMQLTNDENAELVKKYHLPENFALYVGDVTWNKNLPALVNAMKMTSVPLVMVGKSLVSTTFDTSNPWNNDLIEIQRLIKDNSQFVPLGFVPTEDLVKIYNSASVFVMPSIYEGFGLPILEAMSCGCPVITTKEGSIPEVAGEAAYYVNAFSIEDIAQGIQTVTRSKKLREKLSKKGLSQAKNFSWEKTAINTLNTYETKD